MIQILLAHGWEFLRKCNCSRPGKIYFKGRNKTTVFDDGKGFKLVRVGNVVTVGNAENLEMVLTNYGL